MVRFHHQRTLILWCASKKELQLIMQLLFVNVATTIWIVLGFGLICITIRNILLPRKINLKASLLTETRHGYRDDRVFALTNQGNRHLHKCKTRLRWIIRAIIGTMNQQLHARSHAVHDGGAQCVPWLTASKRRRLPWLIRAIRAIIDSL